MRVHQHIGRYFTFISRKPTVAKNRRKHVLSIVRVVAECLEGRTLLAAATWTGGGSDTSWSDAQNWKSGQIPALGDDVVIPAGSSQAITVDQQSVALGSLTSYRPITLGNLITLSVSGQARLYAELDLRDGKISNTHLTMLNGNSVVANYTDLAGFSGTLDQVQIDGALDVVNCTPSVLGGLGINGTLTLGTASGTSGSLDFSGGNQSLTGSCQVIFAQTILPFMSTVGPAGPNLSRLFPDSGETLTIHPDVRLSGNFGEIGTVNATVVNQGTIAADNPGEDLFVGGPLINYGVISIGNGAQLTVIAPLTLDSSGKLLLAPLSTIVAQDTINGTLQQTDQMDGPGFLDEDTDGFEEGNPQRTLEVMSRDLGPDPAGFVSNFAMAKFEVIQPNAAVKLVDQADNAAGTGPEALYANQIIVGNGNTLDLNGLNVYARVLQNSGIIINGTVTIVPDGGPIESSRPTAGNLLSNNTDDWTFTGNAGQTVSASLELYPNGSNFGLGVQSFDALPWGQLSLIGPDGAVLAQAKNSATNATVTLSGISLPKAGIYHLQVSAPANHADATGDYLLGFWNATAHAISLNQVQVGNLISPLSFDTWNFSGSKNAQVQLTSIASNVTGLSFTLTDPDGTQAFTGITSDSSLVTLPADGQYTLTVYSTASSIGGYSFEIEQTSQVPLDIGSSTTQSLGASGQFQLFQINVPATEPLSLNLSDVASSDHNEIYAKFGAPPTQQIYDYSNTGSGANQNLLVPEAEAGTWYVLVYAESVASPPSSFTLRASSSEVIVASETPNKGAADTTTTLTITGAGFNSGSVVSLVSAGGIDYPAYSSSVNFPTQITAVFAAGSIPADSDSYSIRVAQSDGSNAELSNALAIAATGQAILSTHLELPNPMSRHIAETLYVDYTNTGTVAMPAPLLVLSATNPLGQAGALFTLNPALEGEGLWSSVTPPGFSQSIEILGSGATPGVLQPEESERVPVYYAGWLTSQWDFTNATLNFSLRVIQANDATQVAWSTMAAALQPSGYSTAAWNTIYSNLLPQLGTTSGGYVHMLDADASYLGQLGENVNDPSTLWNFSIEQANSIRPLPSLGSITDDSLSTPGALSLSFTRAWVEPITSRYAMGLLGLGWAVAWNESLQVQSDGTVIYNDGDGMVYYYEPDSRTPGNYFSEQGDTAILASDGSGGYLRTTPNGVGTDFKASGSLNYEQDTNGNRITAGYTGSQLTSLTTSSGQSLAIGYDAAGLISTVSDSQGRVTTYGYDASNQYLTSVTGYNGQTTSYTYDTAAGSPSLNALTSIAFPAGTHQYFTYDSAGRLASTFQDNGVQEVAYTYSVGEVTATDSLHNASSQFFDEEGLLSKSIDPQGNPTYYTYDANFNLVRITNALNESATYTYNGVGEITSATDFLGNTNRFSYTGPFNALSSVTDANGNRTAYSYDSSGNLLSTNYADGSGSSTTFNPLGEATSFLNQNGQPIHYTYNGAGQLLTEGYSDGSSYTYTYDGKGNLLTAVDATGTTTFTYDPTTELMTEVAYPGGLYLKFTYNAAGQRTQMVDQTGFTTNYSYDSNGRLLELTDGTGTAIVTYTYDANSRLSQKTNGNGTYSTYAYDADGNVLHLINYAPGGTVNSQFDYTYNSLGEEITEGTIDGTWTYDYDADGQLTTAVFAPNASNPDGLTAQNLVYNYDAMGNRTSTVINGVTTAYKINNLNEYTSVGGTTYSYDADGNLLSNGTNTYTYNILNQLTSIIAPSGTSTYTLNALGQRVTSVVNGQTTVNLIDPAGLGNLVGTFTSSDGVTADYTYGLGLTSEVAGGSAYYYDIDALGSTAGLTDVRGQYIDRFSYLPFGSTLIATEAVSNPFEYAGALGVQADGNASLFMRAREMSSTSGRFNSADPLRISAPTLYTYAFNNPVELADPLGLDASSNFSCALGSRPSDFDTYSDQGIANSFNDYVAYGQRVGNAAPAFAKQLLDLFKEGIPTNPNAGYSSGFFHSAAGIIGGLLGGLSGGGGGGGGSGGGGSGTCLPPPPPPPPGPPGGGGGGGGSTSTVNAQDPNAMYGPAGYGESKFVAGTDSTFPYQIDFENSSTATAPAQEVTITDQLDPDLNWSTFQLSGIGWGNFYLTVPAGSQTYQTTQSMTYRGQTFDVEVQAGIHTNTGVVYATFQSIDPTTSLPPVDALIGFLPPEDGTGRGDGYLSFSIKPNANLSTGTQITNVANITFDNGLTIATNLVSDEDPSQGTDPNKEALVTIDAVPPTSSVSALPANSTPTFNVTWSGSDDANGSGIASYDVFVLIDGSTAPQLWQSATTALSATYTGARGHRYAFYSIATDNAGNAEPSKKLAEATTSIIAPNRFVTFGGKTKGAYTDAEGNLVTVTLSGPGTGTLGFFGTGSSDPLTLIMTGTTAKSILTIHAAKGTTTLVDVEITGSLGNFNAKSANLTGSFDITGTLGAMTLNDINSGPTSIDIEGPGATTFKFGTLKDLSLTVAGTIKSLSATSWTNGAFASDSLTASSLNKLLIKGVFDANVTLSGSLSAVIGSLTGGVWNVGGSVLLLTTGTIASGWVGVVTGNVGVINVKGDLDGSITAQSIKSLKVSGNVNDSAIALTGSNATLGKLMGLGSFTVTGNVSGSSVIAVANVGTVTVGGMSNSELFSGVASGTTGLPTADDFVDASSILNFTVKGKMPFANTDLAAKTIGTVALKNAATSNGGTPFGVAAQSLKTFSLSQLGQRPFRWSNKQVTSLLNNLPDDLRVELL